MYDKTVEADLSLVLKLEAELQTKACRRDRARLHALVAPDFTEVGASGHLWNLPTMLALLDSQTGDDEEIEVTDLTGRFLADGLILVRWDSSSKGHRARRSSLWRRDEEGWRQVHHQGTVLHD